MNDVRDSDRNKSNAQENQLYSNALTITDINNKENNINNEGDYNDLKSTQKIQNFGKRLDNLKFSKMHLLIVIGLGASWLLDGYEVSLLSVLSGAIMDYFNMTEKEIGFTQSTYLIGCIAGSLFFSFFSNKLGRTKLFYITLIIYIISGLLTSFALNKYMLYFCRFLTGTSIGGEISSIFAAIDEIIPKAYRGRINLIVDGTWHIGSMFSAIIGYIVMTTTDVNFLYIRFLFSIGILFSLPILILRRYIPESPRWLVYRGRNKEAEVIVLNIEKNCGKHEVAPIAEIDSEADYNQLNEEIISERNANGNSSSDDCHMVKPVQSSNNYNDNNTKSNSNLNNNFTNKNPNNNLNSNLNKSSNLNTKTNHNHKYDFQETNIHIHDNPNKKIITIKEIAYYLFCVYKKRCFYSITLMGSQQFLYNGIFYTYTLVLQKFYNIDKVQAGLYLIPLSVGSFLGPICLGSLFDTYSRRKMIAITYLSSCFLLFLLAFNFLFDIAGLVFQEILFGLMFFLASPAASSSNLTVSEIFPVEMRAQAMAFFFSFGMMIGGVISPIIFSAMVSENSRISVFYAYIFTCCLLLFAGLVGWFVGIDAENKSLEEISEGIEEE